MTRRPDRVRCPLFPVVGLALWCAPAASAGPQPEPPTSPLPADPPAPAAMTHPDIVALRDPAVEAAGRSAAAGRLLASTSPELREAILWLMSPGSGDGEASRILIDRAAETANLQPWMLDALRSTVDHPQIPANTRGTAIIAIGSVRTRDAARMLISWLDDRARPELREHAARALARLTGRADLGADQRRWRDWFAQVEWLPELEWRTQLAQSLAEAADRAARERDRSTGMLLESLRARFQDARTTEQRSSMLVGFLRHELAAVRRLGLQLTRQELANARPLEPSVAAATESLLADPAREFRRSAAELLGLLSPTDGGQALAAALVREEDPDVVSPLLRSAARNPSPELASVVVRWLDGPEACRAPALSAAAALYAAGHLSQPQDIRTLRDALRGVPLQDLTPGTNGTLAMYYTLGDEADREKVRALLRAADPVRRRAAADLLSNEPGATDALLEAAATDPTLLGPAVRAVTLHRATIEGYDAIAALPSAGDAARREMLLAVAAELPPRDLLTAAQAAPDAAFREAMLARLTETQELQAFGIWRSASQTPHPAVVAGLLMLAQTRLELGQPAGALEVISDLQPINGLIDPQEIRGMHAVALLWLNRLDEAAACQARACDWIDGLEKAIALPHADEIARMIESRFAPLNEADEARFRELASRLPKS